MLPLWRWPCILDLITHLVDRKPIEKSLYKYTLYIYIYKYVHIYYADELQALVVLWQKPYNRVSVYVVDQTFLRVTDGCGKHVYRPTLFSTFIVYPWLPTEIIINARPFTRQVSVAFKSNGLWRENQRYRFYIYITIWVRWGICNGVVVIFFFSGDKLIGVDRIQSTALP